MMDYMIWFMGIEYVCKDKLIEHVKCGYFPEDPYFTNTTYTLS